MGIGRYQEVLRWGLGCWCVAWGIGFSPVAQGAVDLVNGTVISLADGDTLTILTQAREKKKIRLVGIDTPELHFSTPKGMASQGHWAQDASDYLTGKLPIGTEIEVETYGIDNTGKRFLGRINYRGKDMNLEMVEKGLAIPYVICTGEDCDSDFMSRHNVTVYQEACRKARDAGLGVFNSADPLREMPFEFRIRMRKGKPDKFVGSLQEKYYLEPREYSKIDLCDRIFFMKEEDAVHQGYTHR